MNDDQKLEIQFDEKIADAFIFAFNAHSGQYRKKNAQPYIIHPLRVSEFLLRNFPSHKRIEDMRIAAILHDTVEDTWVCEKDIETKFGKNVAAIVACLTNPDNENKKERLNNYMAALEKSSDEAKIVKLADIFDNVLSTDDSIKWQEFTEKSRKMLECLNLHEHNPQFEKIKKELQNIIERKLKYYDDKKEQ